MTETTLELLSMYRGYVSYYCFAGYAMCYVGVRSYDGICFDV